MAGHYAAITGYSADMRSLIKRCLTQSPDRRPNTGHFAPCSQTSLHTNLDTIRHSTVPELAAKLLLCLLFVRCIPECLRSKFPVNNMNT